MNPPSKREIFSIPNIMGYFRILLIPAFIIAYINAKTYQDYIVAAIIIGISGLTDLFDGLVARKFNMITELGKFIDPLADKLTHAAVIFCLAVRFTLMRYLLIIFLIKESFMAIMGLLMLKKYNTKLDGAMWFGKVCTALFDSVAFVLVIFQDIPVNIRNILICICGIAMFCTFILYMRVYFNMNKKIKNDRDIIS